MQWVVAYATFFSCKAPGVGPVHCSHCFATSSPLPLHPPVLYPTRLKKRLLHGSPLPTLPRRLCHRYLHSSDEIIIDVRPSSEQLEYSVQTATSAVPRRAATAMSHNEYHPVQGANAAEIHFENAPHIPPHYSSASESDDEIENNNSASRQAAYASISRGPDPEGLEKGPHTVDTVALDADGPIASFAHATLQTRYSTIARPGQKKLGHNYRPLKQLRKLAQRLIARWVLNFLFCSLMVVMFKYYEADGILTQFEKRIFNGLFLGLSLFISMNMVVRGCPGDGWCVCFSDADDGTYSFTRMR